MITITWLDLFLVLVKQLPFPVIPKGTSMIFYYHIYYTLFSQIHHSFFLLERG